MDEDTKEEKVVVVSVSVPKLWIDFEKLTKFQVWMRNAKGVWKKKILNLKDNVFSFTATRWMIKFEMVYTTEEGKLETWQIEHLNGETLKISPSATVEFCLESGNNQFAIRKTTGENLVAILNVTKE